MTSGRGPSLTVILALRSISAASLEYYFQFNIHIHSGSPISAPYIVAPTIFLTISARPCESTRSPHVADSEIIRPQRAFFPAARNHRASKKEAQKLAGTRDARRSPRRSRGLLPKYNFPTGARLPPLRFRALSPLSLSSLELSLASSPRDVVSYHPGGADICIWGCVHSFAVATRRLPCTNRSRKWQIKVPGRASFSHFLCFSSEPLHLLRSRFAR